MCYLRGRREMHRILMEKPERRERERERERDRQRERETDRLQDVWIKR